MKNILPEMMRAVCIDPATGQLIIKDVKVPVPGKGEVLIKLIATPINPSDLSKIREAIGTEPEGFIPGIEGCGIVMAAGKGLLPAFLMGKRVACSSKHRTSGTWAEYMVTSAGNCFPVSKKVPDEQAAMTIVNPMTALAFIDIAKNGNHRAVVFSAAASALGRMVTTLFAKHQIKVLHIVRSEEGEKELKERGCRYILNSSDSDFLKRLKEWCNEHKAVLMFDAVGGELINPLLDYLPVNSNIVVYGNLSQQEINFLPTQLIRDHKKITGFYLGHWVRENGILKAFSNLLKVNRLLKKGMETKVQAVFTLDEIRRAVEVYEGNTGGGKVLLVAKSGYSDSTPT
jgi:NADPH:quinone reductase-like Zn-dependent oxidoreductase